jgi:hypothetical protein
MKLLIGFAATALSGLALGSQLNRRILPLEQTVHDLILAPSAGNDAATVLTRVTAPSGRSKKRDVAKIQPVRAETRR